MKNVIFAGSRKWFAKALIALLITQTISLSMMLPAYAKPAKGVTVTSATGGGAISADTAGSGGNGIYTTLGDIVIAENDNKDLNWKNSTETLILTLPSGWEFESGQGTFTFVAGKDISAISASFASSAVTISITTANHDNKQDTVTISGLKVRPTVGSPLATGKHIYRSSTSPGSATIDGITEDADGSGGTDFGDLTEVVGALNHIDVSPTVSSPFYIGDTETFSAEGFDQFDNSVSGLTFTWAVNPVGANTINSSGLFTANATGDGYVVTATSGAVTGSSNAFDIDKSGQTITFGALGDKTYGDADFDVSATASSGLTVTFTADGDCSMVGAETVHILNAGTCNVHANQAGDGDYDAAPEVTRSFTIDQVDITVTVDPQSKTYGDADPALTYVVTGSLVGADTFSGALTRDVGENVGGYAITQGTLGLSANYDLTYVGNSLTVGQKNITVTADAQSKTYGDADPALTYVVDALVGSDSYSGALARDAGEAVGVYAINQGTLTAGGNYNLTYVPANLTINQKTINVTATDKAKMYGSGDPALTYTYSPDLRPEDSFTGSLSRVAGEDVGNYDIEQGTLALNGNYILNFTKGNLEITPFEVIDVVIEAKSKTYGEGDPALTYTYSPGLNEGNSFSGSLERIAGEDVGDYLISKGSLTAGDNYVLSFTNANLTINKKAVTITADPQTKIYGDFEPALTYTVDSELIGDDTFSGSLARGEGENVGTYSITQGTLALSGNYELTYAGASLEITKREIAVTAATDSKVYDGTTSSDGIPTVTSEVLPLESDPATWTQTFDTKNIGVEKLLTPSGTIDDGNEGGNYSVTFVNAAGDITAKPITVTAVAKSKVVGASDPILTYTSDELMSGDSFEGSLTRDEGNTVGTYAIKQGTLSLSDNYSLTFVGANFTITETTTTPDGGGVIYTNSPRGPVVALQSLDVADPFTDTAGHWAFEYIEKLRLAGFIAGDSGGRFKPDSFITRAEVVKIVDNVYGVDVPTSVSVKPFSDVEVAVWYAPYISAAKEVGFVDGYSDGTFKPNQSISRAEALKILLDASGKDLTAPSFTFTDTTTSDWFTGYINYAKLKGLIQGYADGSFRPNQNVTKAEFAKLAAMMME